ncbi:unnamed protein product [Spirodela intermedia]|uniref:Uncharacterized protein n=1 Tax=Spirodela intermedia TaxID=51605 RepID=A0A7I8I8M8_SPIIN|nr:unnamed protein product [Spirodela intermedia]CAA6654017.1 unnamed protein product [Spirodela intermedia]
MASLPQKHDPASTSDGSWSLRMDPLVGLIDMKLQELISDDHPRPSIWRVHPDLRKVEEEAYEPKLVSIGPLHHGKPRLLPMEQIKLTYLRGLLNRHQKNSLEYYVAVIRSCLPATKDQYSEKIELSDDEFVEMLVVDGCFIIEYLAKRAFRSTHETAVLAGVGWGFTHLRRDLLLLENQIPFLVLTELFNMTTIPFPGERKEPLNLMELVLKFLGIGMKPEEYPKPSDIFHLLHLEHWCQNPGRVKEDTNRRSCGQLAMYPLKKSIDLISVLFFGLLYLIFIRHWPGCFGPTKKSKAPREIPCATELRAAGIKFKKKVAPQGKIASYLKPRLRNLIALEQCCVDVGNHFTSYCAFVDNIINTAGDVAILRGRGILESKLGSDAEVADLFNSLCKGTHLKYDDHYNKEIFEEVVAFSEFAHNKWRASLVHNYFSNPWAMFSVFAGFLLIALTAVQTYFAVFSR